MQTFFIQMVSGHTQKIEGVKEMYRIDGDYIFVDENDKLITGVPAANMAFYTTENNVVESL